MLEDGVLGYEYGRKYSYSNILYNKNVRNIRIFRDHVHFTQFIDDDYIKFNRNPLLKDRYSDIMECIPRDRPNDYDITKKCNIYYILYNSNVANNGRNSPVRYLYNEWGFKGIYICKNTDEILESLIILLKRGLIKKYKSLEVNTYKTTIEYIKQLMRHVNKKTIKFIHQLRWSKIYCNRLYKIDIINRWKRVYEYGNARLGFSGDNKVLEIRPDGTDIYLKSATIFDIDGMTIEYEDTPTRITDYFF